MTSDLPEDVPIMPTYDYECSQCGKTFEHFQSMKDDPLKDCLDEDCGGKGTLKRLIGAGSGLIFKGSGFYITDYKKSGAPDGESSGPDSGSKEGKTEKTGPKSESSPSKKSETQAGSSESGSASSKSKPDTSSGS